MSWDVIILDVNKDIKSIKNIPPGWKPVSLGAIDEIKQKIKETIPKLIWKENAWGQFRGDGFCLEARIFDVNGANTLSLDVYGGGDPLPYIYDLCRKNNWKAIDTTLGDFLDLDNPDQNGFAAYRQYRDKIVNNTSETQKSK